MTADEIDIAAKKNIELPEDAALSERMLYSALSLLYREYRERILTAEQAKKEKQKLYQAYELNAQKERIWAEHNRRIIEISRTLIRAEKDGCPICKEMARIFDGRQKGSTV